MDQRTLNLFKVKVLLEVCKTNSYRTAAANLFITPSAISKIIKTLEAEWRLKLVISTGNNIKVTVQAEKLAVTAARLLQINEAFIEQINLLNGYNGKSVLHIGSGGSHSRILMNKLMASFLKLFPELEYEVLTNNSAETLKAVENNQLDCGVVSGTIPEDVDGVLIYDDNISLYAYRHHPLAGKKVSLGDIKFPVCLREKGSATRQYVERFLTGRPEISLDIKQTGKNDELTDHLCKTKDAMLFLSDFYFSSSHWKHDYVKIECPQISIPTPVYFVIRKDFPFPKLKKLLLSLNFQNEFLAS